MIPPPRLALIMMVVLCVRCPPVSATELSAVARGETFLAGMFNEELDLLPEYRGSKVFWLYHDNYLAAKVLAAPRPDLAARIRIALSRRGVTNSGKIEILFGEAAKPLPFRHYQLTNLSVSNGMAIRTELVTPRVMEDWEGYADLLLLAAIAQQKDNPAEAQRSFARAEALWDGKGLADRVVPGSHLYATYKLALYLIAVHRLQITSVHSGAVRARLLALQNQEGGWITDYTGTLKPVGQANVETTSLAILALREQE